MPDIHLQYEAKLERLIKAYSKKIQQIYYKAINEISLFSSLSSGNLPSQINQLSQSIFDINPGLKIKLDQLMQQMHDSIYKTTLNSVIDSWALSNQKNDTISDGVIGDLAIVPKIYNLVYNPNFDALTNFIKRRDNGLDLSKRVWNLIDPYKFELEAGLQDGVSKGRSASAMATDLKRNLNEPERLFRRMRDENGNLQLSRAARNYNPGQGVYRSSFQNAIRLTGTETNIAYRSSDHERWNNQPFVKGIEVKTSNNHPFFDECDELKGEYPKDFKFTGWHPRCRCYAVPVLVTDEELNKQEDFLLGITDKQPDINQVEEIPIRAKDWLKNNKKRIEGWKNRPYFVKDNPQYIKALAK